MALLPTIPTSFVPHLPGAPAARDRFSDGGTGVFGFLAYGFLLVAFVLAIGVFAYGQILKGNQASADAALAKAQASLDPATVQGFVRLRDRLAYSSQELSKHIAFSNFFTALSTLLPATVRFTSLHLESDAAGAVALQGSGIAKNFNALAVLSSALSADGRIKSAIFSKISIKQDNSVSFNLSAALDPSLVIFNASAASAPAPLTSTTTVQQVNPRP